MGAMVVALFVLGTGAVMAAADATRTASIVGWQQTLPELTDSPTAAMLATVAGITAVVTVLVNLARPLVQPADFDRFAPIGAVIVGILLAVLGELQRGGHAYVDAALVGLFGGILSQNVNKVGVRTVQLVRGDPPA